MRCDGVGLREGEVGAEEEDVPDGDAWDEDEDGRLVDEH